MAAHHPARHGTAHRARARHPGPLGVDGCRPWTRSRPLGRVITFSLCDEPSSGFPWTTRARLRELPRRSSTTCCRDRRRSGRCWSASRTAVWSRPSTRPATRSAWPAWSSPRHRRRPGRRTAGCGATWPRRGCSAPAFFLGAPVRAYPELKAAFPAMSARAALRPRSGPAGGRRAAVFGSDGAAAAMAAAGALRAPTARWTAGAHRHRRGRARTRRAAGSDGRVPGVAADGPAP